ncbi:MAG: MaoC/PaaZ C-terminal domain-containing protein [bacterium]
MKMLLATPFDQLQTGARWISRGRTITEADIVRFAGVSGDWFPLHTDQAYAARTAYGARIAHGMLVLSVATGLIPLPPETIIAFYGIDRVRFTRPVFIGDTVHIEMEIARKEAKSADRGLVTFLLGVKNQRDETVAILSPKVLVRRQAAE